MSESLIADQHQPAGHAGLVHPALFYTNTAEYLAGTVPYVRAGLAAGEPVMVAVPALGDVRRFVAIQATAAGLAPERVADLILAVHELAANTVVHTDAGGTLAIWADGDHLICQLADTGHISNPLAGRIPVAVDQSIGGRGLVLVNQLCDLVRIHTRLGATTVRIQLRR